MKNRYEAMSVTPNANAILNQSVYLLITLTWACLVERDDFKNWVLNTAALDVHLGTQRGGYIKVQWEKS